MRKKIGILFLVCLAFVFGAFSTWVATHSQAGDVAVVRIEGGIFDAEPIVRQLGEIGRQKGVGAVVLRVDSPGGSVSASQEIYDAVRKLREKKKVVVSMGTVAASGGYYVSLPAEKILANPGTITGSIGVRMELLNAEELIRWTRLKPEVLKSGRLKDIGSPLRPMTDEERSLLESILVEMHGQFKTAVAEARGLSREEVDRLADGRVYTGAEAVAQKLIDGLGSLEDAIQVAGDLAGIQEPTPFYPSRAKERLLDYLMDSAVRRVSETILQRQWRPLYD